MNSEHLDCNAIHSTLALFIDNEIEDQNLYHEFEVHFDLCEPCKVELLREQENLRQLKALLGGACCEEVTGAFQEQLLAQIAAVAEEQMRQAQFANNPFEGFAAFGPGFIPGQTVITTSYTRTEIIDDGIHIQIETTQEFREEFPG